MPNLPLTLRTRPHSARLFRLPVEGFKYIQEYAVTLANSNGSLRIFYIGGKFLTQWGGEALLHDFTGSKHCREGVLITLAIFPLFSH